jgi:RNA polymerase sigma factor for flagellar operon FliA
LSRDPAEKRDVLRLWRDYKEKRDSLAKEVIISHYLGLVAIIAGRIAMNSPPQVEKDDLIGWGVLGLLDAIEKFDPEQNTIFETYASARIRGAIIDQIRSLDWAPRSLRQKARQMEQATTRLREKLGREPAETELALEMEMPEEELFKLIGEIHGAYILSLDAAVSDSGGGEETSLGEVTSDASSLSPEETAIRKEAEQRLAQAIGNLPEDEKRVITLYYYDELTLKEIGVVLGLSESRICQIHRTVIHKLKRHLNASSRNAAY